MVEEIQGIILLVRFLPREMKVMARWSLSMQTKIKLLAAGAAILAVFAGTLFWYFSYYTKTPEYSLKMIQEAATKHDMVKFQKYVDMDSTLTKACDAMMEGLIETERPMPEEAKVALSGFAKMFKAPIVAAFKGSINHYIESGKWDDDASKVVDQGIPIDSDMILSKSGIKDMQFESIEYTTIDESDDSAVVGVKIFDQEVNAPFVLELLMKKTDNGIWRITEIKNFKDYIILLSDARRQQMKVYIDTTQVLMADHDKKVLDIEQKMKNILLTSNLGNEKVRMDLKKIVKEELLGVWNEQLDALNKIDVPESAQTLQRLRLKICDLRIGYCEKYALWLDNKDVKSLKEANEFLKEAKTLEHEAEFISNKAKMDTN